MAITKPQEQPPHQNKVFSAPVFSGPGATRSTVNNKHGSNTGPSCAGFFIFIPDSLWAVSTHHRRYSVSLWAIAGAFRGRACRGWVTGLSLRPSCEFIINWTHAHAQAGPAKFGFSFSYRPHLSFVTMTSGLVLGLPPKKHLVYVCYLVQSSVKKAAFPSAQPPYLYICRGQLTAPACVEAVLLNGGLVANWLLLQSGLWLCPWVIREGGGGGC